MVRCSRRRYPTFEPAALFCTTYGLIPKPRASEPLLAVPHTNPTVMLNMQARLCTIVTGAVACGPRALGLLHVCEAGGLALSTVVPESQGVSYAARTDARTVDRVLRLLLSAAAQHAGAGESVRMEMSTLGALTLPNTRTHTHAFAHTPPQVRSHCRTARCASRLRHT
jgi:hypothetical protein